MIGYHHWTTISVLRKVIRIETSPLEEPPIPTVRNLAVGSGPSLLKKLEWPRLLNQF